MSNVKDMSEKMEDVSRWIRNNPDADIINISLSFSGRPLVHVSFSWAKSKGFLQWADLNTDGKYPRYQWGTLSGVSAFCLDIDAVEGEKNV